MGIDVSSVYVHYAICELMWCNGIQRSIVNWSGRYMYPHYMHPAICDTLFGIAIFHRSIVNWSWGVGYMYPEYMCIL